MYIAQVQLHNNKICFYCYKFSTKTLKEHINLVKQSMNQSKCYVKLSMDQIMPHREKQGDPLVMLGMVGFYHIALG